MSADKLDSRSRTGASDTGTDPEVLLEELRRRNLVAVAMDLLYLFTVAFFAHHLLQGFWPAVIGGIPLAVLLYFGWSSSKPFFAAELVAIALTLVASNAGLIPL